MLFRTKEVAERDGNDLQDWADNVALLEAIEKVLWTQVGDCQEAFVCYNRPLFASFSELALLSK